MPRSGRTSRWRRTFEGRGPPARCRIAPGGAVAGRPRTILLSVSRLKSGASDPVLGYWSNGNANAGPFYVNVTLDDRYLFISNEIEGSIDVLELPKARASAFSLARAVAKVPVGNAPISLTFSSDRRFLFVTSQSMPDGAGWPRPSGS